MDVTYVYATKALKYLSRSVACAFLWGAQRTKARAPIPISAITARRKCVELFFMVRSLKLYASTLRRDISFVNKEISLNENRLPVCLILFRRLDEAIAGSAEEVAIENDVPSTI